MVSLKDIVLGEEYLLDGGEIVTRAIRFVSADFTPTTEKEVALRDPHTQYVTLVDSAGRFYERSVTNNDLEVQTCRDNGDAGHDEGDGLHDPECGVRKTSLAEWLEVVGVPPERWTQIEEAIRIEGQEWEARYRAEQPR